MKKILFASAAALCAAVGFSSFETAHQSFATHNFVVKSGFGALSAFRNSEVISIGADTDGGCEGEGNKCVIQFSDAQVTITAGTNHSTLLKTSGVGLQNVATIATRELE